MPIESKVRDVPQPLSDAKQNRLLCQITDPNRLEKRKTAVRAWRSERPKRAHKDLCCAAHQRLLFSSARHSCMF